MRSRLPNLSALLSIGAAIAVAAAPLCARSRTEPAARSRADVVAVHASTVVATSAADRASTQNPQHRRANNAAGAAVGGRRSAWEIGPLALSRVLPRADELAAARLSARGYDATAPPLS